MCFEWSFKSVAHVLFSSLFAEASQSESPTQASDSDVKEQPENGEKQLDYFKTMELLYVNVWCATVM